MKVLIPQTGVRIAGTGMALPLRVVTNDELLALGAPFAPGEIERLTGVYTRRWAGPGEATSDLAVRAGAAALAAAGLGPAEVDRLIVATVSGDHPVPSTACLVHSRLGLGPVPAVDLAAACAGFLYALDVAARAVLTSGDTVLVIAAEVRSRFVDPADRATGVLFGDGAAAAVLTPGPPGTGLVAIGVAADGRGAPLVTIPAGGSREPASAATVLMGRHVLHMADGAQVYLSAAEGMVDAARAVTVAAGVGIAEIDKLVPHQANGRLLDRVARMAGVDGARVHRNVDRYGNTAAASCAIALHEAYTTSASGARLLLVAAGAGFTVGAALVVVSAPGQ